MLRLALLILTHWHKIQSIEFHYSCITLWSRMPQTGTHVAIPPELADILKQFTKDAIRTQPKDIVQWATEYFRAWSQGEPLPVRHISARVSTTDLTLEVLTAMHLQFSEKGTVSKQEVESAWRGCDLPDDLFAHLFDVGCFAEEIDWIKFFALCCSYLGGTIKNALTHACCVMTSDPACTPHDACMPFETFRYLYAYLAAVEGEVPHSQVNRALAYLEVQAKVNNGMVKVSDFDNGRKVHLG
ncbi:ropporin-1-like [Brachyhypopomus gauderio]|uniref:ropporin-1-like n=1 Tax=Brachyhypopomus gauderio TaxID=698409 RepID=UPI004041648A